MLLEKTLFWQSKTNIFFDSLGLNANLIGSFYDYDLELNTKLKSLSFDGSINCLPIYYCKRVFMKKNMKIQ